MHVESACGFNGEREPGQGGGPKNLLSFEVIDWQASSDQCLQFETATTDVIFRPIQSTNEERDCANDAQTSRFT
jgi:hypothetical protein